MYVPFTGIYISLWGPTLPLLIWALVAVVCGLSLITQAVMLTIRGRSIMRWTGVLPLVAGSGCFVLTNQMWSAYLRNACPYPGYISVPIYCFEPKLAAQAVAQFQPLGWAALAVTVVFLVAGIVGQRQAGHSAG